MPRKNHPTPMATIQASLALVDRREDGRLATSAIAQPTNASEARRRTTSGRLMILADVTTLPAQNGCGRPVLLAAGRSDRTCCQ
jgi:hypothetical protein